MAGEIAATEFHHPRAANRLVLFAPNLFGGGAERTLARLANHWADQGRAVALVTLASVSTNDFPISAKVRRVGLGLTGERAGLLRGVRGNLDRIRRLRDAIDENHADVVVSFIEQTNVLALLAARPLGVPVVVSERTDPQRHPVGRMWGWLRRQTYPRCTVLVVLTDDIAARMRPVVKGRPVIAIPNGISLPSVSRSEHSSPTITAVGRLDAAKGFDRLIESFALVSKRHRMWQLVIVGEGSQREELENLVAEHQLTDRIKMVGRVADPSAHLATADLFALPSRYEGFPNALLEAMAMGLPAVAFDGPSAVRQIVRDGVNGLLVADGDVTAFAEALDRLMSNQEERQRMGDAAREVVDRFSLASFFDRWDAVVDGAVSGNFSQPFREMSE